MKTKLKLKVAPATEQQTKLQKLEAMLRRPEGATISELATLLEWQPHSVRGAISNLKTKRRLKVSAEDVQGGERTYRIPH